MNGSTVPRIIFPRRDGLQYSIEHHYFPAAERDSQNYRGYFYYLTNEDSKNNQLLRVPVPTEEEWSTKFVNGMDLDYVKTVRTAIVPHRDFVLIESFQVRERHLIVFERSNCIQNIRIISLEEGWFRWTLLIL